FCTSARMAALSAFLTASTTRRSVRAAPRLAIDTTTSNDDPPRRLTCIFIVGSPAVDFRGIVPQRDRFGQGRISIRAAAFAPEFRDRTLGLWLLPTSHCVMNRR